MKITDVRVIGVRLGAFKEPFWDSTVSEANRQRGFGLVQVLTDEGVVGECPVGASRDIVENVLRPVLVGQDPTLIEHLWRAMFSIRHTTTGGDFMFALSRVDIALWDLLGKITGQPVWKLLGGDRQRVAAYAAGGYYGPDKGHRELAAEMERYLALGYRAVKMKVGWAGTTLKADAERVRVVRETIGPDIQLMVDANHAYTAAQAIRFGRMIERYEPEWFEEPVPHTDLRGGGEVCAALDIPIATGEMETTRWGFRAMLAARAMDICQADPVNCGGLTEWRKIAALATADHLPLAPHGMHTYGMHCVAALPEGLTVETYPEVYAVPELMPPLVVTDGMITVPDRPGLGLEIDRAALDRLLRA
jgi:L-alanine-DL-glutamate epimerase-like enolase superfamily enzyme